MALREDNPAPVNTICVENAAESLIIVAAQSHDEDVLD